MRIIDCFKDSRPIFSFEFFPPKTPEGEQLLYRTVERLAEAHPAFVSVTYGAGGSTRELTVELVGRIQADLGITAMAHLTCVGHSRHEIDTVISRLQRRGVQNVLALRGDPPRGADVFRAHPEGFAYASELVRHLKNTTDLCVAGAAYPEGHVECVDREQDLLHLKAKVDAGADFLITQLFFDPCDYFGFVDRARAVGIQVPIVPGVMPVTNASQLQKFTQMCGTRIPDALRDRLAPIAEDTDAVVEAGIGWATDQCKRLLEGGAPGIHFYTLNRSHSTLQVFRNLQR
jgi:methylenetetrahydrofolate reductase (NADPH)